MGTHLAEAGRRGSFTRLRMAIVIVTQLRVVLVQRRGGPILRRLILRPILRRLEVLHVAVHAADLHVPCLVIGVRLGVDDQQFRLVGHRLDAFHNLKSQI